MSIKKDEPISFISVCEAKAHYSGNGNQQISSLDVESLFILASKGSGGFCVPFRVVIFRSLFFQVFSFAYNFTKCFALLICKINKNCCENR